MKFLPLLLTLILPTLRIRAEVPTVLLGPKIAFIDTMDGGSLLDVVNQIKETIRQNHDLPISLEIDIPDEELAKVPARLALKKIPAMIALYYVAERGCYEFVFANGVWTLREWEWKDTTDFATSVFAGITPEELAALGLEKEESGSIQVLAGEPWPTTEFGSIFSTEEVILIRAYPHEIESFKALLSLHRSGYKIPTVNSREKINPPTPLAPKRQSRPNDPSQNEPNP